MKSQQRSNEKCNMFKQGRATLPLILSCFLSSPLSHFGFSTSIPMEFLVSFSSSLWAIVALSAVSDGVVSPSI